MDKEFENYRDKNKDMMDEFYKSLDSFGGGTDDSMMKDLLGSSDLSAFGNAETTTQEVDVSDLDRKIAEAERLAREAEAEVEAAVAAQVAPAAPVPGYSREQGAVTSDAQKGASAAAEADTPKAPSKWSAEGSWTPVKAPFFIRRDLESVPYMPGSIPFMYGGIDENDELLPGEMPKIHSVKAVMDVFEMAEVPGNVERMFNHIYQANFEKMKNLFDDRRRVFIENMQMGFPLNDYTSKGEVLVYRADLEVVSLITVLSDSDGTLNAVNFHNFSGSSGNEIYLTDVVFDLGKLVDRIGKYLDFLESDELMALKYEILQGKANFNLCSNGLVMGDTLIPVVENADIFNINYFDQFSKAGYILWGDKNGHVRWDIDGDGILDGIDFEQVAGAESGSVSAVKITRNGRTTTFSATDYPILNECRFSAEELPVTKVLITKEKVFLHVKALSKDGGFVLLVFDLDPENMALTDSRKVKDIVREVLSSVITTDYLEKLDGMPYQRIWAVEEDGRLGAPAKQLCVFQGPFLATEEISGIETVKGNDLKPMKIDAGMYFMIVAYDEEKDSVLLLTCTEFDSYARQVRVKVSDIKGRFLS